MPVPVEHGRVAAKVATKSTSKLESKPHSTQLESNGRIPTEKSKKVPSEVPDPQLEKITPVVVESAQDAIASIESLFGDANSGPTQETLQKETELANTLSAVVDIQKPTWADTAIGDFSPSYDFEVTKFDDPQSVEETHDILSRRLKAAHDLISTIDAQGKPDSPHEAMLEGDGGIPFDTALGVQEAQGLNRVEGITVSEAIANHHYDQEVQNLLSHLQQGAGELDREKTARVLAAYGQELLTAEEFQDTMQTIKSDIAKVDTASLHNAYVTTHDGEFTVYSQNGDVITTLDKAKATALVADAMTTRIAAGEQLSPDEQHMLALSDKITKTGFGLSSWRDEMTVSDQVIGRDEKGRSGLFSKLDVIATEDGQRILVVKKENKCLLVEEGQKTVLRDNFSLIDLMDLAKCPVMPEKQPQDIIKPNHHTVREKQRTLPLQAIDIDKQRFAIQGLQQAEEHGRKEGKSISMNSLGRQTPVVEIGFLLRQAFTKAELLGNFLQVFKKNQEGRQMPPTLLVGILKDTGVTSTAGLGRQREKPHSPHDTPSPSDGNPLQHAGSPQEAVQKASAATSKKAIAETAASSSSNHKTIQEAAGTVQKNTRAIQQSEGRSGHAVSKTRKEVIQQKADTHLSQTTIREDQQTQSGQRDETAGTSHLTRKVTQHGEEKAINEAPAAARAVSSLSGTSVKEVSREQSATESQLPGAVDREEKSVTAVYEEMVELLETVGNSGTIIASTIVDGKNERFSSVAETGESSLGTNERNIRLDPAMMMSTLTKQSVAQSIIQPAVHFSTHKQTIQDSPHIQTTLRLEKSWTFDHEFPTAEPIAAKDFVSSVLSEIIIGV